MKKYRIKRKFAFSKLIPTKNNTFAKIVFGFYYAVQEYVYANDKDLKHVWKTKHEFVNKKKAHIYLKKLIC